MNSLPFVVLAVLTAIALSVIAYAAVQAIRDPDEESALQQNEHADHAKRYENRDQYRKATKCWSRYLQEDPDDGWAYYRRATCSLKLNRYQKASHDFNEAAKRINDPPTLFYLQYARTMKKARRRDEASSLYRIYLDKQPDDGSVWLEFGDMLDGRDDQAAQNAYGQAAENGSNPIRTKALLKQVDYEMDRDTDQAQRYYNQIQSGHVKPMGRSHRHTYRYQKARLAEKAGRDNQALQQYLKLESSYRDVGKRIGGLLSSKSNQAEFIRSLARQQQAGVGRAILKQRNLNPAETITHDPLRIKASEHVGDSVDVQYVLGQFDWSDRTYDEDFMRDFERKLVQESFRRGILVCFGGLTTEAERFLRKSARAEFMDKDGALQTLQS